MKKCGLNSAKRIEFTAGSVHLENKEILLYNKKNKLVNQKSIWKLQNIDMFLKHVVLIFDSGFRIFFTIPKRPDRDLLFKVFDDIRKARKKTFNSFPIIIEEKQSDFIDDFRRNYPKTTFSFFKPNIFKKKRLEFEENLRALKFYILGDFKRKLDMTEDDIIGNYNKNSSKKTSGKQSNSGKYNKLSVEEEFTLLEKKNITNISDSILSLDRKDTKKLHTGNFDVFTLKGEVDNFASTDKNIVMAKNFNKHGSMLTFDNVQRSSVKGNIINIQGDSGFGNFKGDLNDRNNKKRAKTPSSTKLKLNKAKSTPLSVRRMNSQKLKMVKKNTVHQGF